MTQLAQPATGTTISGGLNMEHLGAWTTPIDNKGNLYAGGGATADNLTATAGGTQAAALALTAQVNRVTTVANAADSVLLPASAPGLWVVVVNSGANAMQVFGKGTDTIDGVATATGVSQSAGFAVMYTCVTAGAWFASASGATLSGVSTATQVIAGAGLTGGGALTGNVTLTVDPQFIQYAHVAVTAAQMKALAETPITLVAAPGAGKIIVPLLVSYSLTFVTTAYTTTSAVVTVSYTNAAGDGVMLLGNTGLGEGSSKVVLVAAANGEADQVMPTSVINAPLVLANGGSDLTLGDGTFSFHVTYVVVTS
jgi:hypothetical protein